MHENDGAAFPIAESNPWARGLTKRQIFAMAALQGLLSAGYYAVEPDSEEMRELSRRAWVLADELLQSEHRHAN